MATPVTPLELKGLLEGGQPPLLLDVRRRPIFEATDSMIPGAAWHDPEKVSQWAGTLPRGRRIVVYCVHGHQVSQETAARLQQAGLDAVMIEGGIEGWKAAGGRIVLKAAPKQTQGDVQ
jgi:Fe-Mn family superoxide dismutase